MRGLFVCLNMLIGRLVILPRLFLYFCKDLFFYVKDKKWREFDGWGLHVYVGRFGAGKTCGMVRDAYRLAKKYKQLTIVTNLTLCNFPKWTRILPLRTPQDILDAPENSLVLIDEIGTIFNSRDFAKGKGSVPKILFQHICQCRHRHLEIFATSQRWNFVDKQLRDIVSTVRRVSVFPSHPFCRLGSIKIYDSFDYDLAFTNPMLPLSPLGGRVYLQTDKVRRLYDTMEMVKTLFSSEYVSDAEILQNQGYDLELAEVSRTGRRALRKGGKGL